MPDKARKRPVKPIAAGQVQPQGVWRPGSFHEAEEAAKVSVEAQVLAQMREALQPRLEEELAQLRKKAEQTGFEAGRKAGFEAGYQAGLEQAQTELEAQKQALIETQKAFAETFAASLTAPLDAWDSLLQTAMSDVLLKALKTLMAAEPENLSHFFQQQLQQALPRWQRKKVPFTLRAHPKWQGWLEALLPESELITLEMDAQLPETRMEVIQATSLEVIDWQRMLDTFIEQLQIQLQSRHEQAPSDHTPDTAS